MGLFFAQITKQCFTCGQGFGKTEEAAITEACSNAFPYVQIKYNDKILFELCLKWKREGK
jgi:hypothetical protein